MGTTQRRRSVGFVTLATTVALVAWTFFPKMQSFVFYLAGYAGKSPVGVRFVLGPTLLLLAFTHAYASAHMIGKNIARAAVFYRVITRLLFALSFTFFLTRIIPSETTLLDAFCLGLKARILKRVEPRLLSVQLASTLQVKGDTAYAANSPKAPDSILDLFKRPPTLLLLPFDSNSPKAVLVLWRMLGGEYGLHYGDPPVNPGRRFDHELQWTNSLWLIIRPRMTTLIG